MIGQWGLFALAFLFLLLLIIYVLDHWQQLNRNQRVSSICNIITMVLVSLTAWVMIQTSMLVHQEDDSSVIMIERDNERQELYEKGSESLEENRKVILNDDEWKKLPHDQQQQLVWTASIVLNYSPNQLIFGEISHPKIKNGDYLAQMLLQKSKNNY